MHDGHIECVRCHLFPTGTSLAVQPRRTAPPPSVKRHSCRFIGTTRILRVAAARGSPLARPSASRPEGSPPMARHRIAIGPRASSSAVRALCAHQRQCNASPLARAPHKPFGSPKAQQKAPPPDSPFFHLFSRTPLHTIRRSAKLPADNDRNVRVTGMRETFPP